MAKFNKSNSGSELMQFWGFPSSSLQALYVPGREASVPGLSSSPVQYDREKS